MGLARRSCRICGEARLHSLLVQAYGLICQATLLGLGLSNRSAAFLQLRVVVKSQNCWFYGRYIKATDEQRAGRLLGGACFAIARGLVDFMRMR